MTAAELMARSDGIRMRFLFSTRPFYGHFHQMASVALAAEQAGHEVVFATAETFCRSIEANGFVCSPAGLDPRLSLPDGSAEIGDGGRDWGEHDTRAKMVDLVDLIRAWRPDVIVREQTDFGGLLAAEMAGLPHATLGPAMFIPTVSWRRLMGHKLDRIRREFGLPADPDWQRLHQYLYLDVVPPWYQFPAASSIPVRHVIQPALFDGRPRQPPDWLTQAPTRPIIYVTLGTVYNRRLDVLYRIIDGLSRMPVDVICTVGWDQDPHVLFAETPANVHIERFVPQSLVMPRCQAVICHGGYSTIMGALAHGLPLLIVPLGSDNSVHARRCAELGVGIAMAPETMTAKDIYRLTKALLTQPGWRRRAEHRRDMLRELPGPRRAVELLGRLAREQIPVAARA